MEIQFSPFLETVARYLGVALCFSFVIFLISFFMFLTFRCAKGIFDFNSWYDSYLQNKKGDD